MQQFVIAADPYVTNKPSNPYQLDESIFNSRCVWWKFLFNFKWKILSANKGDPDQKLSYATSDLGLHSLPMSPKLGRQAYMG